MPVHGMELHLTSVEQSMLFLLVVSPGRLLTRNEILDQLWDADYVAGSNMVDRHVRNLCERNGYERTSYLFDFKLPYWHMLNKEQRNAAIQNCSVA